MAYRSLFILLLLLSAAPATLTAAGEPGIRKHIEALRQNGQLSIESRAVASLQVLPALYERRGYTPVWTRPEAVAQLFEVLERIEGDGLTSDDYHLPALKSLRNHPRGDPATAAGFDILMTDALIRLGYHLRLGKVDAEALDSHWNMTSTIGDLDAVLAMSEAIETARIPALVERLRPDHPYYARLRAGLAYYRAIAARGGWAPVPAGTTLEPGMQNARVTALRERLRASGELDPGVPLSTVFDDTLGAAVKTFQARHGLAADGIVGAATLAELNVTVEARIDQIRVNLERARWVLHALPDDLVLTDIAGFQVRLIRNGETVWSTRAQVGTPYRRTPVFRDRIRYLEINPTWTVPPTILNNDILPQVKKDPDYLRQKNMQVLTHQRDVVDSSGIDWQQYPGKPFPYLIRQEPGPQNALGRIKFMFPNKHAVYLHDTPSRSLFEREQRAFSSGCIRIEHPFEFATLLLDDPQWSEARLREVVATQKTTTVHLKNPLTVLLLYWTVDASADGTLSFKADVYDRDPAVLAALGEPFSLRATPILDTSPTPTK